MPMFHGSAVGSGIDMHCHFIVSSHLANNLMSSICWSCCYLLELLLDVVFRLNIDQFKELDQLQSVRVAGQ